MDISIVLTKRYPDSQWTLDGDTYAGLTWLSDTPKPTKKALEAEWAQVEYEVAYKTAQGRRQAAYQATADPVFFDSQRGEATEADWLSAVEAVVVAYPYPVDPSTIVVEPVVEEEVVQESS